MSPPTEAVTDEVETYPPHAVNIYVGNVFTSSDLFGFLEAEKPTFPSRGRLCYSSITSEMSIILPSSQRRSRS